MKTQEGIYELYRQQQLAEEREELQNNAETINNFIQHCSGLGIELKQSNFSYSHTIGIMACYPDLVRHFFPTLIPDKEGLFDFAYLTSVFTNHKFAWGYLYSSNCILMANPLFRRGFHTAANFYPRFTEIFWHFKDPSIQTYIALDLDRVRINLDNSAYREFDTWFGAAFRKNIATIVDGCVKLRPPMDLTTHDISFFFSDAYSLDINWCSKPDIKCFEAEEFKTEAVTVQKNGITYYPVRYIHAEFDLTKNHFRHFDGAVHFYREEEYYARRDQDLHYNYKNPVQIKTLSEKLFKMNGSIAVDTWIEFTSHFLSGNPLAFEYFEGNYPKRISEIISVLRNSRAKTTS